MATDIHYGNRLLQDSQQQQQQVSFHFWSCQLTEANPSYRWEPESALAVGAAASNGDRPKRLAGRQASAGEANGDGEKAKNGDSNGDKKATENGHKNGKDSEAEEAQDNGEAIADADYMQHVLKVNACILGPKSAGVHLVAVRTRCYRQADPVSCPIVCIDPASQRTVALGYEFVLDSQNEVVTFELVEGAGPVWLTGLHQVRMHDADEEDAESVDEEEEPDVSMDLNDEDDEEEEEEDEDDEEEEEEEEEEAARPVAKRMARASKTDQQRPVASPKRRQPAASKKNSGRAAKK